MKYALFDIQGLALAFYSSDIHAVIPDGAVHITDEQWAELVNNPGLRRFDGETSEVVVYAPSIDAAEIKTRVKRSIDIAAEMARLQFITPGAGQALVYQRKEMQARACLATYAAQNPPPLGVYPALDAEINITGNDALAVAAVITALADAWGAVADVIEALRLVSKAAIDAVPDNAVDIEAQIVAIEAAIEWPVNV